MHHNESPRRINQQNIVLASLQIQLMAENITVEAD